MENELRIVLIVCFFCKILAQAELDYIQSGSHLVA